VPASAPCPRAEREGGRGPLRFDWAEFSSGDTTDISLRLRTVRCLPQRVSHGFLGHGPAQNNMRVRFSSQSVVRASCMPGRSLALTRDTSVRIAIYCRANPFAGIPAQARHPYESRYPGPRPLEADPLARSGQTHVRYEARVLVRLPLLGKRSRRARLPASAPRARVKK